MGFGMSNTFPNTFAINFPALSALGFLCDFAVSAGFFAPLPAYYSINMQTIFRLIFIMVTTHYHLLELTNGLRDVYIPDSEYLCFNFSL